MSNPRGSWRKADRNYKRTALELQIAAQTSFCTDAIRACLLEIEQFHERAYPDCVGGCPSHEAMALARKALARVAQEGATGDAA